MPDISYVVPLANFFGVSTDALFDREGKEDERILKEYEARYLALRHKGWVREELALCREVVARYPRNFAWLNKWAYCLNHSCICMIETARQSLLGRKRKKRRAFISVENFCRSCAVR